MLNLVTEDKRFLHQGLHQLRIKYIDNWNIDDALNDARHKLGEKIKCVRKRKGVSQEILAESTGKTREFIGYLERGERSPSFEMIIILSIVLEIKVSELMDWIP